MSENKQHLKEVRRHPVTSLYDQRYQVTVVGCRWCWPGSSSYLDVVNPQVREWWSTNFLPGHYPGATKHLYVWNDMNEPSVFNGPEVLLLHSLVFLVSLSFSPDENGRMEMTMVLVVGALLVMCSAFVCHKRPHRRLFRIVGTEECQWALSLECTVTALKYISPWCENNSVGVQITFPKDLVHHGGVEHRDVHNVFGKLYHEATAAGLVARGAKEYAPHGDRAFVLSRAFFAGTQTVSPCPHYPGLSWPIPPLFPSSPHPLPSPPSSPNRPLFHYCPDSYMRQVASCNLIALCGWELMSLGAENLALHRICSSPVDCGASESVLCAWAAGGPHLDGGQHGGLGSPGGFSTHGAHH